MSTEETFDNTDHVEVPGLPYKAALRGEITAINADLGFLTIVCQDWRDPNIEHRVRFPDATPEEFSQHCLRVSLWVAGKHIQDALPFLSPAERELMISGVPDDDFQDLFPEDEDEEDEE